MPQAVQTVLAAIGWSIGATLIAQLVSITLMWWLGLPPKKLSHEIEDVQNTAVGACFFIVSLTAGLFVGIFTSNGFTDAQDFITSTGWIVLALFLGVTLMWMGFEIAHRVMGPIEGESTKRYIQREIVEEQNAALAFLLGGLAVTPFIAVIFQVI